jgi:hypothetical protein
LFVITCLQHTCCKCNIFQLTYAERCHS